MSNLAQQLRDNLTRVIDRIEEAKQRAGRDAEHVKLVAVTKYVDANTTAALLASGCKMLGESRPQQLWEKAADPQLSEAKWHLIGHLQRNKVARTLPLVDLIHSVDSQRLLTAIDAAALQLELKVNVLLEVNCSGDEAKHGLTSDELKALLPQLAQFKQIAVCGLMTMASRDGGPKTAARNFASLRELRDRVSDECPPGTSLCQLSMGMSHDFEAAIHEGATHVRVGSSLFEGIG